MPDPLLTPDKIRAYLVEVADLLPDDAPQCIVVVGGSLLALLGFREATNDVDSTKRPGPSLKEAVVQVAYRHGLAPRWLNDSAAGFYPQIFNEDDCTVELPTPGLRDAIDILVPVSQREGQRAAGREHNRAAEGERNRGTERRADGEDGGADRGKRLVRLQPSAGRVEVEPAG